MAYKIAYVSSDGHYIDRTFGAAEEFIIVEVLDGEYQIIDIRKIEEVEEEIEKIEEIENEIKYEKEEVEEALEIKSSNECKDTSSCASGHGCGSGCGQGQGSSVKVDLVSDCRCIICEKVGFHIQKQLERLAITTFDVNSTVEEALQKIILYFERIDGHKTLRGIASNR